MVLRILRILLVSSFLSFVATVQATALNITFLHNHVGTDGFEKEDVAIFLREVLEQISNEKLTFEFEAVNRGRSWALIKSGQRYCTYNQLKNAERESFSVFTQYPVSVYPPIRLIAHLPNSLPEDVSLDELSTEHKVMIGFDNQRSYGAAIDDYLVKTTWAVYPVTGANSDLRLMGMFLDRRFEGLFEYTGALRTRAALELALEVDFNHFSIHQLKGLSDPLFGYVSCSDSPEGKMVVAAIDRQLESSAFQHKMMSRLENLFPPQEVQMLQQQLLNKFSSLK